MPSMQSWSRFSTSPNLARCDISVDESSREALKLNAADRTSMGHELLSSLEWLSDHEVEQLWVEEAPRRSAEIDAGLGGGTGGRLG